MHVVTPTDMNKRANAARSVDHEIMQAAVVASTERDYLWSEGRYRTEVSLRAASAKCHAKRHARNTAGIDVATLDVPVQEGVCSLVPPGLAW